MINPETLQKMLVTQEMTPQELVDEYHPSQLEQRFGGGAESPAAFWPPYIGNKFQPNNDSGHLDFIKEEEYE